MHLDKPPLYAEAPHGRHASTSFQFVIDAPMARAAPLFGPEGERAWSGKEWDPQFVYPSRPADIEGAVFTVAHGDHPSVWVNTRFDLREGRMQYVVFVPAVMTTTIDVDLTPQGPKTVAKVTYRRTALTAEAEAHVAMLSEDDASKGPEWSRAISNLLRSKRSG